MRKNIYGPVVCNRVPTVSMYLVVHKRKYVIAVMTWTSMIARSYRNHPEKYPYFTIIGAVTLLFIEVERT